MPDDMRADARPAAARAAEPPEAEVARLRLRLADAEALIGAMISGEVDAIADPHTSAPLLLHEAQSALRKSEERYRDLVAQSPAIVCELSHDGSTLFVNNRVTALLGYRASDLVGRNWWDSVTPPARRERTQALWTYLREGHARDMEIPVLAMDGTERRVQWNTVTRHAVDGTPESVLAFGLDVTEQKRAEESAQRLAVERGARAEAQAAEQRAALLAEASRILSSALDYEATLADVARILVPSLGDHCTIDIETDGTTEPVAIQHGAAPGGPTGNRPDRPAPTAVPIMLRGIRIGAITIACDSPAGHEPGDIRILEDLANRIAVAVENSRLFRAARDARAAAEAANKTKAEFLANMSHELRTPLNAIAGYTQLLDEGINGTVNDKQRDYLRRIRRSQEHLLGLINNILGFAKLEAGQIVFTMTDVAMRATLEDVNDIVAPLVQGKDIRYELRGCPDDLIVRADRGKVRQILVNLVTNAVKFTAVGGTITIECRSSGAHAEIDVRDSGIGVPGDELDAIFEPFVQVAKGANREGSGLGLSISRELARGMQGDLTVSSVPGEGSVFTLSLLLIPGRAA